MLLDIITLADEGKVGCMRILNSETRVSVGTRLAESSGMAIDTVVNEVSRASMLHFLDVNLVSERSSAHPISLFF